MKIAVDFDGTIVDHRYPEIGEPVPGALNWLRGWIQAGAELILWTMRCDSEKSGPVLTQAVEFCRHHGIEFVGINESPGQSDWSNSPKAYASLYIDDAAFGCPLKENPRSGGRPYVGWDLVGPTILQVLEAKRA